VISRSLITKPPSQKDIIPLDDASPNEVLGPTKTFGPGSDIGLDDERLIIRTVRKTHLLIFNKFPVFRPQLLLLTVDSYQRQEDPLDSSDLMATFEVLLDYHQTDQPYYAFYNCGYHSGSSRIHKHVQVLPKPSEFFPDDKVHNRQTIPYTYFVQYLEGLDAGTTEAKLAAAYYSLRSKAKSSLSLPQDAQIFPHNVVMTLEWMVVIPRRDPVSITGMNVKCMKPNSAGMMGSVWLPNKEMVAKWQQLGPSKILAACGVPRELASPE
jgi:ATP adenylyltransferase